jgi:hypothetical protein
MRFRKLRIAFSATCLIACVLLIALWVRSYWIGDNIRLPASEARVNVYSVRGTFSTSVYRVPISPPRGWEWESTPIGSMLPVFGLRRSWSYHSDGPLRYLVFPHRFLVLMFAMLAAVPWLPWWSKRFSLRTLLIATTLIAVVLGLIVWQTRQ